MSRQVTGESLSGVMVLNHGLGDVVMAKPCVDAVVAARLGKFRVLVRDAFCADFVRLAVPSPDVEVALFNRQRPLSLVCALRRMQPYWFIAPQTQAVRRMWFLARCSGARKIGIGTGSSDYAGCRGRHKVWDFLGVLKRMGIEIPAEPSIRVQVTESQRHAGLARLGFEEPWHRLVVLAPGSGAVEAHKRWPSKRYGELASRLVRMYQGLVVGVVGTGEEVTILDEVCLAARSERVKPLVPRNVSELLGLLAVAECVVANCNGASHLAAAVGTPVVGLYGPTNPGYTGPFTSRFHAVHGGLKCAACYRPDFIRGCGDPLCMTSLSVGAVESAVEATIGAGLFPPVPWIGTKRSTRPAHASS